MKTKRTDKPCFFQMLPGAYIDVVSPTDVKFENIEITSNVFVDVELIRYGPCLKIHICGTPKVKKIIYGE